METAGIHLTKDPLHKHFPIHLRSLFIRYCRTFWLNYWKATASSAVTVTQNRIVYILDIESDRTAGSSEERYQGAISSVRFFDLTTSVVICIQQGSTRDPQRTGGSKNWWILRRHKGRSTESFTSAILCPLRIVAATRCVCLSKVWGNRTQFRCCGKKRSPWVYSVIGWPHVASFGLWLYVALLQEMSKCDKNANAVGTSSLVPLLGES